MITGSIVPKNFEKQDLRINETLLQIVFGDEICYQVFSQLQNFKEEANDLSSVIDKFLSPRNNAYLPQEDNQGEFIIRALKICSKIYDRVDRKHGTDYKIPLFSHAVDVASILISVEQSSEVIVAGLLHDAFEGYGGRGEEEGKQVTIELLHQEFGDTSFSNRIIEIIQGVTEEERQINDSSWFRRKESVLEKLRNGDRDIATVACASKISTLSTGNVFEYQDTKPREDRTKWSKGTHSANVKLFGLYHTLFLEKEVEPVMIKLFENELYFFSTYRYRFLLNESGIRQVVMATLLNSVTDACQKKTLLQQY
jgi:(p)ppGpp synthase/HD superfamily hydrolase